MLFIAHRGESHDAPENTLAAFELAWKRRNRAIELDVHLTRDGELAVCHDANTQRVSGVSLDIRKCSMEELGRVDVGSWKGVQWAGERIPRLREALLTVPAAGCCIIEVKVGVEAIPVLEREIHTSSLPHKQIVIISFDSEVVAESKRMMPDIKTYLLAASRQSEDTGEWSPSVEELIAQARDIRADGLNLAAQPQIDRGFADRVKSAGLELFVWTVDSLPHAKRMVEAGVDGIASNRAAWLKRGIRGMREDCI